MWGVWNIHIIISYPLDPLDLLDSSFILVSVRARWVHGVNDAVCFVSRYPWLDVIINIPLVQHFARY